MENNRLKREDERGALEGLPLYLIILVVIAGVGTAIIAGWMMSAQGTELGSIEVDEDQLDLSGGWGQRTITVTAYDENGDALEGVTVSMEGCGAGDIDRPVDQTDEDGEVSFTLLRDDLHVTGGSHDHIEITAEYTGDTTRTETETILVIE